MILGWSQSGNLQPAGSLGDGLGRDDLDAIAVQAQGGISQALLYWYWSNTLRITTWCAM